jgi:hypothetical protein
MNWNLLVAIGSIPDAAKHTRYQEYQMLRCRGNYISEGVEVETRVLINSNTADDS